VKLRGRQHTIAEPHSTESLKPDYLASVQSDNRLVEGVDPALQECCIDFSNVTEPTRDVGAKTWPVTDEAAAACLLGMIQRKVRVLPYAFCHPISGCKHGTADSGARSYNMTVTISWLLESGQNPASGVVEITQRVGKLKNDGKLIAAQSESPRRCNLGSNPVGGRSKKVVACLMTEGIVHNLKVIEIEHQKRPRARDIAAESPQSSIERCPVAETGKSIGECAPFVLDHALVTIERDCTQMNAIADDLSLEFCWPSAFAIVEGECPNRLAFGIKDRAGPAGAQPEWES
jgi:hypothetical protein